MVGHLTFRREPPAVTGWRWRRSVAALAAFCLALAAGEGLANQDNNNDRDRDEQRDTQSRHEQKPLGHIPLVIPGGRLDIERIVLIQTQIVEVSETSFGIDFESLDRVDVSDFPLLGGLFGKPLQADDLTEDNRVGAVYSAGADTLAVVLDDNLDISGNIKLSVVNGKGRYNLSQEPRILDIAPTDLGEFGALRSVQTVIEGIAPEGTTIVLGGLTRETVPETTDKVPVLGDIPVLQSLLRGSVHQLEQKELVVFIRPSIITGDEGS